MCAETPAPAAPVAAAPTHDLFAAEQPDCRELTNGCQVCVRGDGGQPRCSMPGIACQPRAWSCNQRRNAGSRLLHHPPRGRQAVSVAAPLRCAIVGSMKRASPDASLDGVAAAAGA
jgi:hypothetical protein